jgi:uncharacterized membrane protein
VNATSPTTPHDVDALAASAARSVELAPTRALTRLASIDVLRGLVIVIMAIDHVRAYFTDVRFDPLDPAQTNLLLYFTRWITNFCAPVFVFLAGTSAYLIRKRNTAAQTAQFLATRGLWLIVLEVTLITSLWMFNFDYAYGPILQVIWAIGVSMVFLAALVRLRWYEVGAVGVAICALHNLLEGVPMPESDGWRLAWSLLYVKGATPIAFVYYPLLPWLGVMAMGYALGVVFDFDAARRRRVLVWLGSGAIGAFFVLRLLNGYGDPDPWSRQGDAVRTVMSFLDVEKYPPSLMFVLVTIGPALLLLAAFESAKGPAVRVFTVFGRVPFCFYVLHIPAIHLAAGLTALAAGYGTQVLTGFVFDFPAAWGVGLGWVYAIWVMVVIALYPVCRWFAGVKRRRRDWWLSYV